MPGQVDEAAWSDAKRAVRRQYPDISEESDRFWRLVQSVYSDMSKAKSLFKAGEPGDRTEGEQRKLANRYTFQGLKVSVENAAGSYRGGEDWETRMGYDYGYIRGTEGADGEHLDCYVGPASDSDTVFVVRQVDPSTGEYDEDKVMLGFASAEEAKIAYLTHYDRDGFFGGVRELPMDAFKLLLERHQGKRLTNNPQTIQKRFVVRGGLWKEQVPAQIMAQLQWEPPGGTHPNTWRAQYGGKYIYRPNKPGADPEHEESGQLFTQQELSERRQERSRRRQEEQRTLRQQTIGMTPEQHLNAAKKKGVSKLERDFHRTEAQKKLDLGALRQKIQRESKTVVAARAEAPDGEVHELRVRTA